MPSSVLFDKRVEIETGTASTGLSTPSEGSSLFSTSSGSSRRTFVSAKSLGGRNVGVGRRPSRKSLPPFLAVRTSAPARQISAAASNGKTAMQMLSGLVGFVRGKLHSRKMRAYALRPQSGKAVSSGSGVMHRTRSSLRRPQLLSVRQRDSLCAVQGRAQAFELLLAACRCPEDVAALRAQPEQLVALGIPVEELPALFEELHFFMGKCQQLKEAEQRVEQRKRKVRNWKQNVRN